MAQDALDTWLPFGRSKLASSNWLTRGVGGLAGARPALPNMAGGKGGANAEEVDGPNVGLPGQPAP